MENEQPMRLQSRIDGTEMEKILLVCGKTKSKFAESMGYTRSTVTRWAGENRDRKLSLIRIQALKDFVGEDMYEAALWEVRMKKSQE